MPTLLAILLVAIAARALPAALDPPLGADAVEYENVAGNLLAGRGFVLDVRAYHAADTPVVHYAGHTRPPLLPVVWAGLEAALPAGWAPALLGPLLYLATIALVFDWLRAVGMAREAPWVGLLMALQPGLLDVSIRPLTEPLTLLCVVGALWAHARLRSPALAGLACALAFLARPSAAVAGIVLGLVHLVHAVRGGGWGDFARFAAAGATGPIALVALNLAAGAPATTSPQGFLWRAAHYLDAVRYLHRGGLYESAAALVADRGLLWVAGAVAANALAYAKQIVTATPGLGYLVPLLGFAAFGWKDLRRGSGLGLLALIGALDLLLYCLAWSTRDVYRFTALAYTAGVVVGGGLAASGLRRIGERAGGAAARWLAPVGLGVVVALWSLDAVVEAADALRGIRHAYDDPNAIRRLASLPELGMAEAVLRTRLGPPGGDDPPIVASNEAWVVTHALDRPAFILPWDLRRDEWMPFVAGEDGRAVLIHRASWPADYRANLRGLEAALRESGWRRTLDEGEITLWLPPAAGRRPDVP